MSTNPQLGFDELAAAQSQPEVPVNAADRWLSGQLAGEVTIDFGADADMVLAANQPPDGSDQ